MPDAILLILTLPIWSSCSLIAPLTVEAVVAIALAEIVPSSASCSFIAPTRLPELVVKFSVIPTSSCNSLIAPTRSIALILISSFAEAPVFNSMAFPNAGSIWVNAPWFAAAIAEAFTVLPSSVVEYLKFALALNEPAFVTFLNKSRVDVAFKTVPLNPFDWFNTVPSTISETSGEPVRGTLPATETTWNPPLRRFWLNSVAPLNTLTTPTLNASPIILTIFAWAIVLVPSVKSWPTLNVPDVFLTRSFSVPILASTVPLNPPDWVTVESTAKPVIELRSLNIIYPPVLSSVSSGFNSHFTVFELSSAPWNNTEPADTFTKSNVLSAILVFKRSLSPRCNEISLLFWRKSSRVFDLNILVSLLTAIILYSTLLLIFLILQYRFSFEEALVPFLATQPFALYDFWMRRY